MRQAIKTIKCILVAFGLTLCPLLAAEKLRSGKPYELHPSALNIDTLTAAELGLTFEEVTIEIPGLKRSYDFLWVADLHVIGDDLCEVAEKNLPTVTSRRDETFRNPHSDLTSLEVWKQLPEVLNGSGADAVLFGGDICDFATLSSIRVLRDGMKQLTIPFLYVRADHDVEPWWLATNNVQRIAELEKSIDDNPPMQLLEFEDLLVIGWNNSTSNLTEAGLKRFKELCAMGKPIIFVTHVPLQSKVDSSFDELCRTNDSQGRSLLWGSENKLYVPNEFTRELLDMVYAEGGPVKAVLAAHLHIGWHGMLTDTISQHLFVPALQGNIGVIHVRARQ